MAVHKRFSWKLLLVLPLLAVLGLGGVALREHLNRPQYDYEPIEGRTALDDWQPPWTHAAPESPSTSTDPAAIDPSADVQETSEDAEAADLQTCDRLPKKWMMIGWDGAEWEILIPLIEEGKLPHLTSLMQTGTYGNLASIIPNISPAIWTTVATGVSPGQHGILHFYNKRPALERWWNRLLNFGKLERYLFSNADRRSPAIWNLLSENQRRVLMVGYHNTFPVEEVHGMMVSNYLVQDSIGDLMQMKSDGGPDTDFGLSLVHPHEHLTEVLDIQETVHDEMVLQIPRFVNLQGEDDLKDFIRSSRELERGGPNRWQEALALEDSRPYFLTRAYTYDTILAEVADQFLPRVEPDFFSVHFQSLDWADHYFLYHHDPEAFDDMDWSPEIRQHLEAQLPRYRKTVEAFYIYMDEWLGRFLEHRDDDTAVLLLSDHGVGPGEDPEVPGYHDDGPPGMVVWNGPGIPQDVRLEGANVYDILPTLMAAMGLPVAEDLEGRVLDEVFCPAAWPGDPARVASYQDGERFVPSVAKPPQLNDDLVKQLESLGYIK